MQNQAMQNQAIINKKLKEEGQRFLADNHGSSKVRNQNFPYTSVMHERLKIKGLELENGTWQKF